MINFGLAGLLLEKIRQKRKFMRFLLEIASCHKMSVSGDKFTGEIEINVSA